MHTLERNQNRVDVNATSAANVSRDTPQYSSRLRGSDTFTFAQHASTDGRNTAIPVKCEMPTGLLDSRRDENLFPVAYDQPARSQVSARIVLVDQCDEV